MVYLLCADLQRIVLLISYNTIRLTQEEFVVSLYEGRKLTAM